MRQYLLLLLLLFAPLANAWGPLGHKVICDIAWRQSSTYTKRLLSASAKRMGYRTFAESCVWADRIRRLKKYKAIKPLHYVNVDPGLNSVALTSCLRQHKQWHKRKPRCVLDAIGYFIQRLQRRSLSIRQRDEALLLLAHFVGDAHQPLHVSDIDDRGGTRRWVVFAGKSLSLHQVWDSHILYCGNESAWQGNWSRLGKHLHRQSGYKNGRHIEVFSPTESVIQWADESLQLTHRLYQNLSKELPKNYCQEYHPIALKRLQLAGLRLAALLSTTLVPQGVYRVQSPAN